MDNLHFDFTRCATRAAIWDGLCAHMSGSAQAQIELDADNLTIPDEHHHDLAAIDATIERLNVEPEVRTDLHAIYRILAEAEASAHGCSVDETHFHEVGEASAIRNTAKICLAIDYLHPARITATPIQTGSGTVQCAHGIMKIPAPATAATIARGIPVCDEKLEGELCTPTSAAIIYHFVDSYSTE